MAEKFFEQKFEPQYDPQKEERERAATESHQLNERFEKKGLIEESDEYVGQQFDRMVEFQTKEKELRDVSRRSLDTIESDPEASDLFHLKEKAVDPLLDFGSLRTDRKLQSELREAFIDRYRYYIFPGYVSRTGLKEPETLSYVVQKLELAKSGLLKDTDQIYLYEPGREDRIPKKVMEHGLKIAAPPANGGRPPKSPTMALYDTDRRLGFHEDLSAADENLLIFASKLVERVENGQWIYDAANNFYDENDMTLMKLNRLLPIATLTGLIRDLTAGENLKTKGNPNFKDDAEAIIRRVANAPLPPALIEKYGLDKRTDGKSIIEKQKETIVRSKEYLEEGKNRTRSNLGNIVYVRSDGKSRYEKLPGLLPAIAAKPPERKNHQPLWQPVTGYVEAIENDHITVFVRKDRVNGSEKALERAAAGSGCAFHTAPVGQWLRMSVTKPSREVIAALEASVFGRQEPPKEAKESNRSPKEWGQGRRRTAKR